jgi:putative flippase GtrA
MVRRFVRFNVVGALGIGVRTAALAILTGVLGLHYLVATVLAVELSLLHNFFWHVRWTWRADGGGAPSHVFFRCLAFHAGTGLVSMLGGLALMPLLVAGLGVHYLVANLVAIACTGIVNFVLGDRVVFRVG